MGVPKFFRYTSERYPCLNELVKQYQIPDFDNMYLDMNGIIHNCSHPDDSNPHFRITEEKIMSDIFHYIGILFQIIKPKKLFFMAIDGVAPRAKMNQQRGRRFRSAREAEKLEEAARAKGEVLPSEKRFDSNCITPGTIFMARLHEQLKYFVKQKMSTDPLWSKVKVILSGHETPGEGEHKIMDYIRWARSQPDYDPNTRHCLYGLDADLIMLGMCTHEPHFALLREEVKFGKTTQRTTSPEETNFYLLHLSLLREYLEQEFIGIKDKLPFEYDIEKIVDDWVLMGFLVGNDFIPHLPNMHISNDALPLLYKTYMTVLPTLDGYINEAGDLNLRRFETFLQELAKIDKEKFQDTYADLKYFEGKTGRRPNMLERKEYKPNNDETFNIKIEDILSNKPDDELQALIDATQQMYVDDNNMEEEYEYTSEEENTSFEMEFVMHKTDYYMNKLDYSKVTEEVLANQAEGYVRAIQWNLFYYYKGCPSWCWYYPHHYAPFISDIKGFEDLKIEFELGEPFKPFEQLLAVLPSASKQLLPAPFHDLMTDEDSPIVHYYPIHFETDLNGKKNDWEAVVLIPFIDEANLLSSMAPCYQRLTDEELKRNTHGPMLVYNWSAESQGTATAPEYFPPIINSHAIEKQVWRHELDVSENQLKRGMLPNARRDMLYPGFPTMRHLKYEADLKKGKVKVFDLPSRGENMIIKLIRDVDRDPPLEEVAKKMLGKTIWVGWPHITKAKVISVSNEKMRLHHIGSNDNQDTTTNTQPNYSVELNEGNLQKQWVSERATVIEHNMNRLGIDLGTVKTLIHAVNLKGYTYLITGNMQMAMEHVWCSVPCSYAYQAIVTDVSTFIVQEAGKFSTPLEAYPSGDTVFLLTSGEYYGSLATVTSQNAFLNGRIRVQVSREDEPVLTVNTLASPYRNLNHAAAASGMTAQMFTRITGAILVVPGERNDMPTENMMKYNLGLNLKLNKKNLEISGFTRRCLVTNSWLYSQRCIDLVQSYVKKFPIFFARLLEVMRTDILFESDLWPDDEQDDRKEKTQEIIQWIKAQPHTKAGKRECGSEAMEPEEMKSLANCLDKQLPDIKSRKHNILLKVKWNLLYKPELHEGNIAPDPKADYKMYDRIVNVARNITVPIGAKGTITAIYQPSASNTVRLSDKLNAEPSYQVMFDEPFPGATSEDLFEEDRFYRMIPSNMLNISYGRKLRNLVKHTVPTASEGNKKNQTPNLLRREDGHNSAFANYSPTRETKTPVVENKRQSFTHNSNRYQDTGTQLLKSLLKISQTDTDLAEDDKSEHQYSNWRSRNDGLLPTPPGPRNQQNWRQDNNASYKNNSPQQPMFGAEYNNRSYKNQPGSSRPNYLPYTGPGPSQIPFPQFQKPQFQPRGTAFGYQPGPNQDHNQRNLYNQNQNNWNPGPSQQMFPVHLPSVTTGAGNFGPGGFGAESSGAGGSGTSAVREQPPRSAPSTRGPSTSRTDSSGIERLINPFVPPQVQTSLRRMQNQANIKVSSQLPAPTPVLPQTVPTEQVIPPQQQTNTRPKTKKKPRIAANLPFQLD